jgi:hypothetical protein
MTARVTVGLPDDFDQTSDVSPVLSDAIVPRGTLLWATDGLVEPRASTTDSDGLAQQSLYLFMLGALVGVAGSAFVTGLDRTFNRQGPRTPA